MTNYSRPTVTNPRGVHHSIGAKLGISAVVVLVVGAIMALIVGLGGLFWGYEYGSEHNVTFKIEQVTNIATGNSHEYDIYTSRGNVLMNGDSIMHGKTDSANVQAWLSENTGKVVTCPVYGWRVFILSSKEDVLDGCKVTPDAQINY